MQTKMFAAAAALTLTNAISLGDTNCQDTDCCGNNTVDIDIKFNVDVGDETEAEERNIARLD